MRKPLYFLILVGGVLTASHSAIAETKAKLAVTGLEATVGKTHAVVYQQDWRYRYHNGTWWYWLPSNRWVVWSNGQWVDYVPNNYGYASDYYGGSYGYNPGYYTGYRGYGGYGYGGYGGVIIGGGHHHHGGGYHGHGGGHDHHGGGHHGGGHHGSGHHH